MCFAYAHKNSLQPLFSGHIRAGQYVALWVTGELKYPCSLAVFGDWLMCFASAHKAAFNCFIPALLHWYTLDVNTQPSNLEADALRWHHCCQHVKGGALLTPPPSSFQLSPGTRLNHQSSKVPFWPVLYGFPCPPLHPSWSDSTAIQDGGSPAGPITYHSQGSTGVPGDGKRLPPFHSSGCTPVPGSSVALATLVWTMPLGPCSNN